MEAIICLPQFFCICLLMMTKRMTQLHTQIPLEIVSLTALGQLEHSLGKDLIPLIPQNRYFLQ